MRLARVVAATVLAVFAAAPVAAACPNAGLATMPVVLVTAKGRYRYVLDVAASGDEQQCGLMYRKAMPRGVGMVFPFDRPRSASFWMENTPLPLDLIFVGPDNRVLSVSSGEPFSRAMIDSGGLTAAVIELNAGEAKRIGLQAGDKVVR